MWLHRNWGISSSPLSKIKYSVIHYAYRSISHKIMWSGGVFFCYFYGAVLLSLCCSILWDSKENTYSKLVWCTNKHFFCFVLYRVVIVVIHFSFEHQLWEHSIEYFNHNEFVVVMAYSFWSFIHVDKDLMTGVIPTVYLNDLG